MKFLFSPSSYILSLPTAEEQDSYLQDMLDPSNRDHADLLIEFTEKREEFARRDEDEAPPPGIAKVYRKKALDVEEGRKKKESAAQVAPPKTEVTIIRLYCTSPSGSHTAGSCAAAAGLTQAGTVLREVEGERGVVAVFQPV